MPRTVIIFQKYIKLDGRCDQILEILKNLQLKTGVQQKLLTVSEPMIREKTVYCSVVKKIEDFTGDYYGAHKVELPESSVKMDDFAEKIYEHYKYDTRSRLHKTGVTAQACTAKIIDNEFVLIREIWLRLIASTLSVNSDKEKVNEETIKQGLVLAKSFISELKKQKLLPQEIEFSHINTDLTVIENSIHLSSVIHANEDAVQCSREFIMQARLIIKRQLLMFIDPKIEEICLSSSDEVNYWLKVKENEIIKDDPSSCDNRDSAVIRNIENRKYAEDIARRYDLLNKANVIDEIINCIDSMMDVLGWLPILTGVLNFEGLKKHIEAFNAECFSFLNIEITHPIRSSGALFSIEAETYTLRNPQVMQSIQNLKELADPVLLSRVVEFARGRIQTLIRLQKDSGIEVLDEKNLHVLEKSLFSQISQNIQKKSSATPASGTNEKQITENGSNELNEKQVSYPVQEILEKEEPKHVPEKHYPHKIHKSQKSHNTLVTVDTDQIQLPLEKIMKESDLPSFVEATHKSDICYLYNMDLESPIKKEFTTRIVEMFQPFIAENILKEKYSQDNIKKAASLLSDVAVSIKCDLSEKSEERLKLTMETIVLKKGVEKIFPDLNKTYFKLITREEKEKIDFLEDFDFDHGNTSEKPFIRLVILELQKYIVKHLPENIGKPQYRSRISDLCKMVDLIRGDNKVRSEEGLKKLMPIVKLKAGKKNYGEAITRLCGFLPKTDDEIGIEFSKLLDERKKDEKNKKRTNSMVSVVTSSSNPSSSDSNNPFGELHSDERLASSLKSSPLPPSSSEELLDLPEENLADPLKRALQERETENPHQLLLELSASKEELRNMTQDRNSILEKNKALIAENASFQKKNKSLVEKLKALQEKSKKQNEKNAELTGSVSTYKELLREEIEKNKKLTIMCERLKHDKDSETRRPASELEEVKARERLANGVVILNEENGTSKPTLSPQGRNIHSFFPGSTSSGSSKKQVGNLNSKGYIRYTVLDDGDCGYTAFGITRKEAHRLLNANLNVTRDILKPVVSELLITEQFLNYLKTSGHISANTTLQHVIHNLERYSTHLNILAAFIDFDVRDGQIDAGWAHPATLQALACIQGITIYIWELGQNAELVPHHEEMYRHYVHPENTGRVDRVDLLFLNGNHFERLEFIGFNGSVPLDTDFPVYPVETVATGDSPSRPSISIGLAEEVSSDPSEEASSDSENRWF